MATDIRPRLSIRRHRFFRCNFRPLRSLRLLRFGNELTGKMPMPLFYRRQLGRLLEDCPPDCGGRDWLEDCGRDELP